MITDLLKYKSHVLETLKKANKCKLSTEGIGLVIAVLKHFPHCLASLSEEMVIFPSFSPFPQLKFSMQPIWTQSLGIIF